MRNIDIRTPKNIEIGERSVVNKGCLLDGRGGSLIIGDDVDIAQDVYIWTQSHKLDGHHTGFGKGVTIENHCWIGARSTILPGIKIGTGAVVGTCSVVTHDVPPYSVVAGNPAKIIGHRHNKPLYKLNFHPWFY